MPLCTVQNFSTNFITSQQLSQFLSSRCFHSLRKTALYTNFIANFIVFPQLFPAILYILFSLQRCIAQLWYFSRSFLCPLYTLFYFCQKIMFSLDIFSQVSSRFSITLMAINTQWLVFIAFQSLLLLFILFIYLSPSVTFFFFFSFSLPIY